MRARAGSGRHFTTPGEGRCSSWLAGGRREERAVNEIPFNRPYVVGTELGYIEEAHANGQLSGNGPFTRRCEDWLAREIGSERALLTHSCTAALEMAAILAGMEPGDEVIMPSFTFVVHGERRRAPRRDAGVRRHPRGHAEPRRAPRRGSR